MIKSDRSDDHKLTAAGRIITRPKFIRFLRIRAAYVTRPVDGIPKAFIITMFMWAESTLGLLTYLTVLRSYANPLAGFRYVSCNERYE
jgi:hypothetical protein